ncbi:MAG: hypothetical protein JSV84_10320, partial [Gemmatimonadota bacterium]
QQGSVLFVKNVVGQQGSVLFVKNVVGQQGSVLLLIFFCATMVSVLGLTTLYLANTELTESSKKYEMSKAFYLAEGGLQRAFHNMNSGIENGWSDEIAGTDGTIGTEDDGILNFGRRVDCYSSNGTIESEEDDCSQPYYLGCYEVRVEDGRDDEQRTGVCNRAILRSTGISTQNFRKSLEAEIEIFELPWPPAVVFLVPGLNGTYPNPTFNGQSWMIDGNDRRPDGTPDGTPGTGSPILGIASNVSVNPVLSSLAENELDQVRGADFDETTDPIIPSVRQVDLIVNLYETVDYLKGIADNNVVSGTYSQFTGEYGNSDNYQVTYCSGDLHLSGRIEGYGVLVVDGHLTLSGQGTWNGYIFCTEGAEFTGGGRPFHLYGAMILGTPSGGDRKANFTCSGQADLYYSQETVEEARTNLRAATYTYWSEL